MHIKRLEAYNLNLHARYYMVLAFHEAMGLPIDFSGTHREHKALEALRENTMNEEAQEFLAEVKKIVDYAPDADITKYAKEIAGFEYTVLGTIISFGFALVPPTREYSLRNLMSISSEWSTDALALVADALFVPNVGDLLPHYDRIFAEVHRSNMSKLGDDGKPILREDGKILKGLNFSPADLSFLKQFFQ